MLHFPKSRAEWLMLRHKHISSTEVSALFNMNKYMTAYELAVGKKAPEPQEWEGSERSSWGLLMQRVIADRFAEQYGLKIRALNAYASSNGLGASFDYEIVGIHKLYAGTPTDDNPALAELPTNELQAYYLSHGPGVLEIKNVDSLIYKNEWEDDEAPAHIEIQVQTQLECIQRPWAVIAVLVGGNRMVTLVRTYDEEVTSAIVNKTQKFWSDLNKGVMPPVSLPEDAAFIALMYKYSDPSKVLDLPGNEEIVSLCKEYEAGGATEKAGKNAKDSAKARILMMIGDASRVLCDGYTISANTTAEAEIEAYTRKAFRNLRITPKKAAKA